MSDSRRPLAPRALDGQPAPEVVVGRMYLVPTVRGSFHYWMGDWVVLGPKHEDADYIGFSYDHYHFDWRFMDTEIFESLAWPIRYTADYSIFTWPLAQYPEMSEPLGPVVWRRRKCRRPMPKFPRYLPKWLPVLEDAYANHTLTDALICPHRGAALGGLARDAEGCVVCPLHGLKWNLETRRLVRDVDDKKER